MSQIDPLLQPFQLKHLTLKNRIFSSAHAPSYAEDEKPKLRYQLYQEEKAKGGIARMMTGFRTITRRLSAWTRTWGASWSGSTGMG